MSEKTIYCGSGKKQNETWLKVSINIDKIKDHIEEYKGHKFVRLNINIKDEVDEYGKNVSLSVDKWQPEEQPAKKETQQQESESDLPF
jgi:gas vesicle protein